MQTTETYHASTPEQTAAPKRPYRVSWLHRQALPHGGERQTYRTWQATAESPERAVSDALVGYYGALRPAMAPERAVVDDISYAVEEWTESACHVVSEVDVRAADRARAARAMRHLLAVKEALSALGAMGTISAMGAIHHTMSVEVYLATLLAELDASAGGAR